MKLPILSKRVTMNLKTEQKFSWPWEQSYPENVSWHEHLPTGPLYEILEKSVLKYGTHPCVEFMGKEYTYAEIGQLVNKAAKGLQEIGVKKGTKVGIFLPNTPYSIIFYYATLRIGGIVVNFSPLYVQREIIPQINDSETEVLVTLDLKTLFDKVSDLRGSTHLKKIVVCSMGDILPFAKSLAFKALHFGDIAKFTPSDSLIPCRKIFDNDGKFTEVPVSDTDIAVLQYTGGTTGIPKGAMLTHSNLYANTVQCELWCGKLALGQERMLGILPLFHVFAMTAVMNVALKIGAEIILMPRFELKSLLKLIHQKRPTVFPAVPTIFTAINHSKSLDNYDLSSLKLCISGGAPLPVSVKRTFEAKTGCSLVEGYGLSETSPIATANPFFGINKEGSIGIPVPGTIIEIRDPEYPDKVLPIGEKGEICVRGPQVMAGYWKREDETKLCLRNGLLYTGDIGYMDEEGYVFVVDRIKDVVICGGFNVYPRQVEEVILLHPSVQETTVIGVPDEYRGQTVKAFVIVKPGEKATADDIFSFLKDKLSPIEMPKHIEFRDELPKTMVGKHSKKELVAEEMAKYTKLKAEEAEKTPISS
jgi:long-chain acyl-CoA synthetase